MDASQILLTVLGSVLGSGAVLGFLQFLIQRKDKKVEDAKRDEFEEIRKEFKTGLNERENAGKARYDEHQDAIQKMTVEHEKDFKTLLTAIEQLKDNDIKVAQALDEIKTTNENISSALVGLAHDKLVYSTDKIINRGAVTLEEKAILNSIYEPYRAMNGNGLAKAGMEQVEKLPVVGKEEAMRMDKERRKEESN